MKDKSIKRFMAVKTLSVIAAMLLASVSLPSCGGSGGETPVKPGGNGGNTSGDSAVVSIKLATASSYGILTKAAGIAPQVDENAVNNVCIMVFDGNGKLVGSKYTEFSEPRNTNFTSDVTVSQGTTCTVYAVANMPESTFTGITSVDGLNALTKHISSAEDIGGENNMVMFGRTGKIDVSSITDNNIPSIKLRRIAGRLDISIAPGQGITITGYQLCHVPMSSYVADSTSTSVRYNPESTYGDFTSVTGQSYTSSFTNVYYTYENLVGKNANATTQLLRTTANAPANATYMTIWAEGNSWKSEYKIYIGGATDDSTDYDIDRNGFYTYYIEIDGQGASDLRVIRTTAGFSGSTISGWQNSSGGSVSGNS